MAAAKWESYSSVQTLVSCLCSRKSAPTVLRQESRIKCSRPGGGGVGWGDIKLKGACSSGGGGGLERKMEEGDDDVYV